MYLPEALLVCIYLGFILSSSEGEHRFIYVQRTSFVQIILITILVIIFIFKYYFKYEDF